MRASFFGTIGRFITSKNLTETLHIFYISHLYIVNLRGTFFGTMEEKYTSEFVTETLIIFTFFPYLY